MNVLSTLSATRSNVINSGSCKCLGNGTFYDKISYKIRPQNVGRQLGPVASHSGEDSKDQAAKDPRAEVS